MHKVLSFITMLLLGATAWAVVPTPANPTVTDYQRRGFRYELKINVPLEDKDGYTLEKENLSYRLYIDGQPFTFKTSDYSYIEADMTEIPWDYQDANGYGNDIMKWYDGVSDNCRRIFLYSAAGTVAVESVYRTTEGEAVSAKYVYDTASNTGYVDNGQDPDVNNVISALPEGAENRLYTLDTWMMEGVMLQHYTWSGRFDNLAFDGSDIYFKDICGMYRFGTYVKGTLMNDGATLRVAMMQQVFHQAENEAEGVERADVYLQAIRINEAGDALELLPDVEYVDFTVNADGVLKLGEGMGIAYVGHDGHLLAKNIGYEYRPFNMEAATVNPPAELESVEYSLTFSNEPDGTRSSRKGLRVVIDKDNAAVYVKGLSKTMTGWAKGTIDGNKVVFPSHQYIGTYVNDSADEFAVYLNGATATDEYDLFGRVYATKENLTFDYDSRLGTMKSGDSMTETIGTVNPLSHIVAPELVPVSLKPFEPATPANPSITSWRRRGFMYELIAEIPAVDTRDEPLDINGLVYRFYINGSETPFEFSTGTYNYIDENMTDIPWDFQDQGGYGYDIMKWSSETTRRIYFYEEPQTVALESSYTIKGETHSSLRYLYDVATGEGKYMDFSGISTIAADKAVVSVTYTDMTGKVVSSPVHGLYIKSTRYADGTVRNEKVFIE